MAEQQLTELINHKARPVDDRENHLDEPTSLIGCLGWSLMLGVIAGIGIFWVLLWMEG